MKEMSDRNFKGTMSPIRKHTVLRFFLVSTIAGIAWSCAQNEQSPGVEFMPDMYRSPAIEAYMDYHYPDSLHARKPVEGTIPFDAEYIDASYNPNLPYPYPDNTEGYETAGEELENPLPLNEENLEKGEQIFTDYCEHCHGGEGKGDGPVIENGGHAPPPSFTGPLSDLPEGKAFHSITYGKGLMGSHASQLNKKERWLVVHYVKVLQNGGADPLAEQEDGESEEEGTEAESEEATEEAESDTSASEE